MLDLFNRKEVKKEAKKNLKRHYLKNILIVFICTIIITGSYYYKTSTKVYNDVKDQNIEVLNSESKTVYDILNETVNKKTKNKEKKVQNGILAPLVNEITDNNSVIFGIINIINKSIFGGKVSDILIIFSFTIISLLISIFIRNVFVIGKNRYFIEQRRYNSKIDKILFPFKIKKIIHIAYIIFIKNTLEILWYFTIIGGIIKQYEYSMIPYLLAENPTISKKEAFRLSKEMTNGEKFNLFILDLSLLGWRILDLLTFGLCSILFTDGYTECINAEIYMKLREKVNFKKDEYLNPIEYKNEEYPEDKYLIKTTTRKWLKINYEQSYSLTTYILFFFTFAIAGWIWEVFLTLLTSGHFSNRGTMFGPWLPIYGFGIIFILLILEPFRKKPLLLFILTMLLCGILEYTTAWYLETFVHMKWWDYTGYFLNLHGRICLEGLLVFGLGGTAITYLIAPILNNIYIKINPKVKITICIILLVFFGCDIIYSISHPNTGKGIADTVEK